MPGNEPLFENQLNSLYDALTKNDIAGGLELLRQIGDSRNTLALQPLLILLEFPDEQVRRSAAVALGNIGDASAVQPLIKALKDPAAGVQEDAAYALGAIGDERATGPLNNVPPGDPRVKKAAEFALVQIRRKGKSYSLFSPQGTAGGFVAGRSAQPAADRGNGHHSRPEQPPEKQAAAAEAAPVLQKAEASSYGQPEVRPAKVVNSDGAGAPRKSELLAAFASFLIPGLGQLYNGEKWTKALLYLIGFCVGTVLLVVPGLIVWLYGIYNAYKTAKKVNAGELPFKKTETGMLILYAIAAFIITIVFMIVVTIILAAVIAAFVFQMGGSYGDQYGGPYDGYPSFKSISVGAYRLNNDDVTLSVQGDDVASLTGLTVLVNGTEVRPAGGKSIPRDGLSATYPVEYDTPFTVFADFSDGTSQLIYMDMIV